MIVGVHRMVVICQKLMLAPGQQYVPTGPPDPRMDDILNEYSEAGLFNLLGVELAGYKGYGSQR